MQKMWRSRSIVQKIRKLLLIQSLIRRLQNSPPSESGKSHLITQFSVKEIGRATFGFSLIVGSTDPHGSVYKAQFSNGHVAVVRKLRRLSQCGDDGFYREVELLGGLHHRNLVGLRGFSNGRRNRFLVLEYMENGSLKDWLHDPLKTPLCWKTRLQIAISVAAALEYLLFFCDPPVFNISISSKNVFLDENLVAKVCHLGISAEPSNSSLMDPKRKHIVYQFGALILELVTGQSFEIEGVELIRWINQDSSFSYSMHKMVDADLGENYDSNQLRSLLKIARLCTKRVRDYPRITIRQILRYLQRKVGI